MERTIIKVPPELLQLLSTDAGIRKLLFPVLPLQQHNLSQAADTCKSPVPDSGGPGTEENTGVDDSEGVAFDAYENAVKDVLDKEFWLDEKVLKSQAALARHAKMSESKVMTSSSGNGWIFPNTGNASWLCRPGILPVVMSKNAFLVIEDDLKERITDVNKRGRPPTKPMLPALATCRSKDSEQNTPVRAGTNVSTLSLKKAVGGPSSSSQSAKASPRKLHQRVVNHSPSASQLSQTPHFEQSTKKRSGRPLGSRRCTADFVQDTDVTSIKSRLRSAEISCSSPPTPLVTPNLSQLIGPATTDVVESNILLGYGRTRNKFKRLKLNDSIQVTSPQIGDNKNGTDFGSLNAEMDATATTPVRSLENVFRKKLRITSPISWDQFNSFNKAFIPLERVSPSDVAVLKGRL